MEPTSSPRRGTLPTSPVHFIKRPISPETSSLRQQAAQSPKTQQRPEPPAVSLNDIAFTMEGTAPRLSKSIPYGYAFCFTEIPKLQIPQENRPKSPLQRNRNHEEAVSTKPARYTTPVTFINGHENLSTAVRPEPQRLTAPQAHAERQSPPQVRLAWG